MEEVSPEEEIRVSEADIVEAEEKIAMCRRRIAYLKGEGPWFGTGGPAHASPRLAPPEDLAAIRARCEAATPAGRRGMGVGLTDGGAITVEHPIDFMGPGDVAFYEQARSDVHAMLAEIERLTKVAAAERGLRLAINDMVRALSDGGRLNAATARASEAAAALRALDIEP